MYWPLVIGSLGAELAAGMLPKAYPHFASFSALLAYVSGAMMVLGLRLKLPDLPFSQNASRELGYFSVGHKGETFVIKNPDGSISFDAYAGMSRDELKTRCLELCSAVDEWQFIAMDIFESGKDSLSPESRSKVERLIEAYALSEVRTEGAPKDMA